MIDAIGNFWNSFVVLWQSGFNMILDWFIGGVNAFFSGLGEMINDWLTAAGLQIEIPSIIYTILNEITIGIGYILPVRTLLGIPLLMISFYVLKFIFSIYQVIASTVLKRVKINV